MKKQKYIIASVALLLFGTIFVSSYFGSLGSEKYIKNNSASVWSSVADFFGFGQCTPETIPEGSIVDVDDENNTIDVTIPYGVSSMCFTPEIQTFYSKAVITPDPNEPQDFTNPVTYTINQGGFIKEYVVTVNMNTPVFNITTCNDLQKMNIDLSGDYTLANDIDCSDTENWNGGQGFRQIGNETENGPNPFTGSFDGKGYTISSLYINRPTENSVGLFGYVNGHISNLGLIGGSVSGNNYVGGLVGTLSMGTISNSYSSGEVTGNDTVGGFVGMNSGVINNSYSAGNVSVVVDTAGGFVGTNDGTIDNSYSTSNLSGGGPYTAGFSGYNGYNNGRSGVITNSYSTGLVEIISGSGFSGFNSGSIIGSYWDTESSGKLNMCSYEDGGSGSGCDNTYGKTTDEMKKLYTFNSNGGNWDVSGGQANNNGYPYPYLSGTTPVWYIADNTNTYCDANDPNCCDATDPNCWSSNIGPMMWANLSTNEEFIYTNANDYNHGDLNTQILVALGSNYEAANSCNNLVENGYDDWYLPAINELTAAYNAGVEGFNMDTYLSSTEYSNWTPKSVEWNNGGYIQDGNGKNYDRTMVRCLRGSKYSAPSVGLNASSSAVVEGDTVTLTWTPENSTSCTASGNDPYWNGSSLDATSGSHSWTTAPLTAGTHTYNISCAGDSPSMAISTVTVVVETIPTNSCPFNNVLTSSEGCTSCGVDNDYLITSCGDKPTSNPCNVCSSPDRHLSVGAGCWYCVRTCGSLSGTEGMILDPVTNECGCPPGKTFDGYGSCVGDPTKVNLNASPATVVAGDTAVLTWTPENSTSCTASGNDPYWNGSSLDATSGSHSWTTAPLIAGTHTYNISCDGSGGSIATSTVTVITKPLICSSFTYSPWSNCSGGNQTRTVVTSSPSGCSGGQPEVLSQSCIQWSPNFVAKNWETAFAFCADPANGYTRLPTRGELVTALNDQFVNGGNNPGGFLERDPVKQNQLRDYFSSELYNIYLVYISYGYSGAVTTYLGGRMYETSFRCVR